MYGWAGLATCLFGSATRAVLAPMRRPLKVGDAKMATYGVPYVNHGTEQSVARHLVTLIHIVKYIANHT